MAGFDKRGKNQVRARIRRIGYPEKSRTFYTQAEAGRWARAIESEIDRGLFIDRTEAEKNTLGDILARYAREVTPRHKGAKDEGIRIKAMMRHSIMQTKMAAVSSRMLAEWRDERLQRVKGPTARRELNIISAAINKARRDWGVYCENPVELMERPQDGRSRERRFKGDEESRLTDALNVESSTPGGKGTRNIWMRPLVLFALETAMRRGELLSLRWDAVNMADQTATLEDTKNGERRVVPLSTRALALLKSLPRSVNGLVFPTSADAVQKAFKRACKNAHLDDFKFHDLRHEATSRLAKILPNVIELSKVTGHKSLEMLKRYYHIDPKDLARKLG